MDFHKHPISQSLIGKFLHKGNELEYCPKLIYHTEMIQDIPRYISEPMNHGRFFETLCLGSSVDGEKLTDLPRKRLTKLQTAQNDKAVREGKDIPNIAKKKISQERLEHQALIFKQLCVKYQVTVEPGINTQVPIRIIWDADPSIILSMTLDIFPTSIMGSTGLYLATIDLKATGNIHNTFGDYCYGDPDNLDKTQGWMYHYGVRNIDFDLNPHLEATVTPKVLEIINASEIKFLLWVFDYKKEELENKFVQVRWNETTQNDLFESIRKTVAIIEKHEAEEWPTRPKYAFCLECSLKNCLDRTVVENI